VNWVFRDKSKRKLHRLTAFASLDEPQQLTKALEKHHPGKWQVNVSSMSSSIGRSRKVDVLAKSQAGPGNPGRSSLRKPSSHPPYIQGFQSNGFNDIQKDYASEIQQKLSAAGLWTDVDNGENMLQKKIRNGEIAQHNFILAVLIANLHFASLHSLYLLTCSRLSLQLPSRGAGTMTSEEQEPVTLTLTLVCE
jgi:hypothetical protein